MQRSLLRSSAAAAAAATSIFKNQCHLSKNVFPAAYVAHQFTASRSFATKKKDSGSNPQKLKHKGKKDASDEKSKSKIEEVPITPTEELVAEVEEYHRRRLAEDYNNKSLDVGPNGRPLFTTTSSLSQLTRKDTCHYMEYRWIMIFYIDNMVYFVYTLA